MYVYTNIHMYVLNIYVHVYMSVCVCVYKCLYSILSQSIRSVVKLLAVKQINCCAFITQSRKNFWHKSLQ